MPNDLTKDILLALQWLNDEIYDLKNLQAEIHELRSTSGNDIDFNRALMDHLRRATYGMKDSIHDVIKDLEQAAKTPISHAEIRDAVRDLVIPTHDLVKHEKKRRYYKKIWRSR